LSEGYLILNMNKKSLKKSLDNLKVNPAFYSLEGELLPDRLILNKNYIIWEVFYFDERGNINNLKKFTEEEEACLYIYDYFKKHKVMDVKNKYSGMTINERL
jgi:hypothetical protein